MSFDLLHISKCRVRRLALLLSLAFIILTAFSVCGQRNVVTIFDDRNSEFRIVISDDADVVIINAANRLAHYLFEIGDVSIPIITHSEGKTDLDKPSIFIGFNESIQPFTLQIPKDQITRETVIIKSHNFSSIVLAGGSSRATLYAVYEFLEEHLDCKWWTPEAKSIPRSKTLKLRLPINTIYTPPFEYRSHFAYNTVSDSEFAIALKENGYNQPVGGKWGGRIEIAGWAHTFASLLPVDKYFRSHPEWYADASNSNKPGTKSSKKPLDSDTQPCLENPALFEEFLKNTLAWIKEVKEKSPTTNIFSVSINDNKRHCRCEDAIALMEREKSPAASLINFLNKLVVEINKVYPDVKLQTLAYFAFLEPPLTIKPNKNVIVMVAPVEADFGSSIIAPNNKQLSETLERWGRISNSPMYWGYNTNFNHLLMPHPSIHHVQTDFRFLDKSGYDGIFLQDNRYTDGVGYFLDLQAWVIGKLMWNPYLDQDKLMDEFLDGYYGPAGVFLKDYINLVTKSYLATGNKLETFNDNFSFITSAVIKQGDDLFAKAVAAVADNPKLVERVQKEKISFDLTKMLVFDPNEEPTGRALNDGISQVENFYRELDRYKVKNVDFRVDRNSFKSRLKSVVTRNQELAKSGLSEIIIQESNFTLFKRGTLTDIVVDSKASDGLAATASRTREWAIQSNLSSYSLVLMNKLWAIEVYVKPNFVGDRSNKSVTIEIGVFDQSEKKVKVQKKHLVKMTGIRQNYVALDIPQCNLTASDIVYVSIKDPDLIKALFVDKIKLKKL